MQEVTIEAVPLRVESLDKHPDVGPLKLLARGLYEVSEHHNLVEVGQAIQLGQ